MPAKTRAGFYLTMFCKPAFVCFSVAVILHAFGVIGDPFAWFAQIFPFPVRR